ncbi:hypothetical protein QYH69_07870 [Paraburkholderia sp. SARCC-3016]|uniref:hypothetical protein n=1 Tax=Paraburkholderia sp. SARCC-3016 TaxID=3058611 RepID=UPI0028070CC2|nr:hypothetical protein [Paraburkholderia sp. SARCC-3016]MDQ7977163.1 hypothetical protein [Paraburkholderia sp. SARCC-3016]
MEMSIPQRRAVDGEEIVRCDIAKVKGYKHSFLVPERTISHAEADEVNAILRRNGINDLTALREPLPKRRGFLSRLFGQ